MQTPREIFNSIMHYKKQDQMFIWNWAFGTYGNQQLDGLGGTQFWNSTINRWHSEGLPIKVNNPSPVNNFFNIDHRLHLNLHILVWPTHKNEVIKVTDKYKVIVDMTMGAAK